MIGSILPLTLAAAQPALVERTRTVILFAPDRNDPMLRRQQAMLRGARAATPDLHLIEVVGDTVAGAYDYAAALRQRYAVDRSRFGILLIGRDGGVELRAADAIAPDELIGTPAIHMEMPPA